ACSVVVKSKVSDFQREVIFQLLPTQYRTPTKQIAERLCGNEANLRLADDFWFRPSTLHIVLGADLYSEIMLPGFQPSRAGSPIAQNTVFGWIFSGACAHQ
ncbi:hypothetical protein ACLKA6_004602, partial [Drosophila palustris]